MTFIQNWDNTEFSCHICHKNDFVSCEIRNDLIEFCEKHFTSIRSEGRRDNFSSVNCILETIIANYCGEFKRESPKPDPIDWVDTAPIDTRVFVEGDVHHSIDTPPDMAKTEPWYVYHRAIEPEKDPFFSKLVYPGDGTDPFELPLYTGQCFEDEIKHHIGPYFVEVTKEEYEKHEKELEEKYRLGVTPICSESSDRVWNNDLQRWVSKYEHFEPVGSFEGSGEAGKGGYDGKSVLDRVVDRLIHFLMNFHTPDWATETVKRNGDGKSVSYVKEGDST